MPERTYNDREIKELMERAAQLQASVDDRPDLGLTLSELEQIAAEAGIDPAFLRTAVREADTGVGLRNVSGQTSNLVFVECTVPGALTDDEWHDVVLLLRKRFSSEVTSSLGTSPIHNQGVTEQLGTTREWRHSTISGVATTVSIRSVDDVQHVRIQRRVGFGTPRMEGITYGFMISLVTSFIAGGIAESVWVMGLSLVACLLVLAPTIEWLDRQWRAKKLAGIREAATDIAGIIRNDDYEGERAKAREAKPLISLEDLPDVEDVEVRSPDSEQTRS